LLQLPRASTLKVVCRNPRILGLSRGNIKEKIDFLQAQLALATSAEAAETVQGYPFILGISVATIGSKIQRLQRLTSADHEWQQQWHELVASQRLNGTLGRVLAAGFRVLDRLQYLMDAQQQADDQQAELLAAGVQSYVDGDASRKPPTSAVSAGRLRLTTILLMSEERFTSVHPDIVLWRLKQRT